MHSFLEMPSIRQRISRITVDEYHLQPEYNANGKRTELLRGIVFEKKRKPPLRSYTTQCLHDKLWQVTPPEYHVRCHEPLTLLDSEPEPDVAIAWGSIDNYRDAHPATALLVAEVAVETYEEDCQRSFIYAEAGVNEYWIVLPEERRVEVRRLPVEGRYTEVTSHTVANIIQCCALPIKVSLTELFRW